MEVRVLITHCHWIRENGNVHTVTHITDFKKNFADIDLNKLKIFSYRCCSLIFGFCRPFVWNVLDIFGIDNFIFSFLLLRQHPSHCFQISHDSKVSAYRLLIGY